MIEKRGREWIKLLDQIVPILLDFRSCKTFKSVQKISGYFPRPVWGVCTLAITVAKTSSHYDRFVISVPVRSLLLFDLALQDRNVSGPKGPLGTRRNGGISADQRMLFENARYSKTLIRSLFTRPFYFNRSGRLHIRKLIRSQHPPPDNAYLPQPAMEVQGSSCESTETFITRLCRMLCRLHDDQRAGSILKQRISVALQIDFAACCLPTVSDIVACEEVYYK